MLLSICLSTYNRPEYLNEILSSVHREDAVDGREVELIVLNNGSSNETTEILNYWLAKFDFKVMMRNQNTGYVQAIFDLINIAEGEWLTFPGDDDVYLQNGLKHLVQSCRAAKEKDSLISFSSKSIDEHGADIGIDQKPKTFVGGADFFATMIFENVFIMPATAVKQSFLYKSLPSRSLTTLDWLIWLGAGLNGNYVTSNRFIISYRRHNMKDQETFLEETWENDRLTNFLEQIYRGFIFEYLKTRDASELYLIVRAIEVEIARRVVTSNDRCILLGVCSVINQSMPNFNQVLYYLLIKAGVDPRLCSSLLATNLTEEDFGRSLEILDKPFVKFYNGPIPDVESEDDNFRNRYLERLSKARKIERTIKLTFVEASILSILRRIKRNRFVKMMRRR